jgi:hypothetical protein
MGKNNAFNLGLLATTSLAFLCLARPSYAYEYTFPNGIEIQFQNTLQYSVLQRVAPVNAQLNSNINGDDGDKNLAGGIVSNRFDLISKLNVSYQNFGFDASVDSFYDFVYNQKTQNTDALTYNPAQEPPSKFTAQTIAISGRNIELRNLFAYGSSTIFGDPVTIRVGRFVNLFGESLLFAANGISYGQAPIDAQRAASVPNTQAKDLFLPVGQADGTVQFSDAISATAYYQFEWEKGILPPEGSYFSTADLLDGGGQRIIAFPPTPNAHIPGGYAPGGYFYRNNDIKGSTTGQFGLAVHYDPPDSQYDIGFYALQYNDSEPQVYTHVHAVPSFVPGAYLPSLSLGTYQLVYADHIQIYGVSASTTVGPTNFAGEISARTNEPLNSTVTILPGPPVDAGNGRNALYAKGNTLHYQASAIYLGPGAKLWDASTVLFEAAGDNLLGFSKNRENFTQGTQHMAIGLRAIPSITYYSVVSGLDLTPSIGFGYNFMGKAPDTAAFNNTGIDRGGDITFGLSFLYLSKWSGGIDYTYYIAPPGRNPYADRDFVAFNVERTF